MYTTKYVPPTVTVDGVLFQISNGNLAVLLIRRARPPFAGMWALPGGYSADNETTTEALDRALIAKAGTNLAQFDVVEQLHAFDAVGRDPRGHAVSISYMALGRDITPLVTTSSQQPQFFPVTELPDLAYDHGSIIARAQERLKEKLSYSNVAYALLPKQFTFPQLQATYEAVLQRSLDKRNFRKKFLALDFIVETDDMLRQGAHRPARLYAFRQHVLHTLIRNFD